MIRKYIVNWTHYKLFKLAYKITTIDNILFDWEYNKLNCHTPKLIVFFIEHINPLFWLSNFIDVLWYFIGDNDIEELINYDDVLNYESRLDLHDNLGGNVEKKKS